MKKRPSRLQQLMHRRGIWFILAFALIGSFIVYASYAAVPAHYSIVVVAGQSNADGAESFVKDTANNFDLFRAKSHPADSSTKIMWSNLSRHSGNTPVLLKTIGDAQTQYGSSQATFGPEVGLARGLYDQGRKNVLILKVSYGGLSLGQKPGMDWNAKSPNEAYTNLVNRMKDAKAWVASQGGTASVDGFYWVQGEADAVPDLAPQYETNLRSLVTRARTDLAMNSQAPFVLAKTSIEPWIQTAKGLTANNPCGGFTCDQLSQADTTVRTAQQRVADTVPNTKVVDILNLPRTGFKIHLSNEGELQLGTLFAQATQTNLPIASATPNSTTVSPKSSTSPAKPSSSGSLSPSSSGTTQHVYATPAQAFAEKPLVTEKSPNIPGKSEPWWRRVNDFFKDRWTNIIRYLSS